MVFWYQNCSDLLCEKKYSSDREKLLKFETKSQEFAIILRSLKSVHFKKAVAQSSFLSKAMLFLLTFFYFSENDNTLERNEDCAIVFLK